MVFRLDPRNCTSCHASPAARGNEHRRLVPETLERKILEAEGAGSDPRHSEVLLKAGALQRAIFNSANFSSIATDARGVIQIFNVGAERMLGYAATEGMNKITPAAIPDPPTLIGPPNTEA